MDLSDFQTQDTIKLMTQELKTLDLNKDENNKKAKKFAKNVFLLIVAHILIKIMGLITRILIVNIPEFGNEGNGYYSSGYEVYAIMLTLSSIGIPTVISKLVAQRVAKGDKKGANRIFKLSFRLFTAIGLILSIIQFVFAEQIASNILGVPQVAQTLRVLAPAIVFVSMAAIIRGYFSGLEDMKSISYSQTFEQLLNCILTVALIQLTTSKGPEVMAAAGNLATTISIIIAFIYIAVYYNKHKLRVKKNEVSPEEIRTDFEIIKEIMSLAIPIIIGSLISVLHSFIDTATLTNGIRKPYEQMGLASEQIDKIAMEQKGILSKINTIVGLPQSLTIAISTVLVPSISGYWESNNKKEAKEVLRRTILSSLYLTLPMTVGLFVLAEPSLKLLYPNASEGGVLMMMLSVATVFLCMTFSTTGGLQGIGDVVTPSKSVAIGAVIKIVLNMILIPIQAVGIFGAAISTIIAQIFGFIYTYKVLSKKMEFKIQKNQIFKIIYANIAMGIITYCTYNLVYNYIISSNAIAFLISLIIAILSYIYITVEYNILDKETILNLPKGELLLRLIKRREEIKEGKLRVKERNNR